GSWQNGWQVFENQSGNGQLASGQAPLLIGSPLNSQFTLSGYSGAQILFQPSGRALAPADFYLCAKTPAKSSHISVQLSGSISLHYMTDFSAAAFAATCPAPA
ncbi:MAG: GspH/FimT family protein, partial [Stenotrophobium sp.]